MSQSSFAILVVGRDYRPIPHLDVYDPTELADENEDIAEMTVVWCSLALLSIRMFCMD
jgi:hypothetical protein